MKLKLWKEIIVGKTLLLTSNLITFATTVSSTTTTENNGNTLGGIISQKANDLTKAVDTAKTSLQHGIGLADIILFLIFAILPTWGAYYWYTHYRGNPQQGSNTVIATILAILGLIAGIFLWSLLDGYMKAKGIIK